MTHSHYLFRRALRSPGFTAMIVATIAVTAGIVLGVSPIVGRMLLGSLSVPNSSSVVYYTLGNGTDTMPRFSWPAFEALRRNEPTRDVMAWQSQRFRVRNQNGAEIVKGATVSGNAMQVLQIRPFLGRVFKNEDDVSGGGADGWSAVIGYSYWKEQCGARTNVVGETVRVNGVIARIIGVLPVEFTGLSPVDPANILLPSHFQEVLDPSENRLAVSNYFDWFVFGRLPLGVHRETIQANLASIEPWFRKVADPEDTAFKSGLFSNTSPGTLLGVQDGIHGTSFDLKALYKPMIETGILVGLIVIFCACNLALLFVNRARRDAHSGAIRLAMGATIADVTRFAVLETMMLAGIGFVVAIPLSWAISRILSRAIQTIPGFATFPTVIPSTLSLVIAGVVTLAVSCLPSAGASVWQTQKHSNLLLKARLKGFSSTIGMWVIGLEMFAAVVLITFATLAGISYWRLFNQDIGLGDGDTVTASVDMDALGMSQRKSPDQISEQLLDRIRSSPGVQGAAVMNMSPLLGSSSTSIAEVRTSNGTVLQQEVWPAQVSAQYFSTIGTKIVRGREFHPDDVLGGAVCILSKHASLLLFPGDDPLGKLVYQGSKGPCRVLGIAEDAHLKSVASPADNVLYVLSKHGMPNIFVRAATANLGTDALRNAIAAIAPDDFVLHIVPIRVRVDDGRRLWKLVTFAGAFCGCVGAGILAIGFFGSLSLQVAERQRELGILLALGANQVDICASLVKTLHTPIAVGFLSGSCVVALAVKQQAETYLFASRDMVVCYVICTALLVALMIAAGLGPLVRALRISPLEVLGAE